MPDSIDNKKIVDRFSSEKKEHAYIANLDSVSEPDKKRMRLAGIDTTSQERSGTYLQKDHSLVHCNVAQEGLEVMDINAALATHPWLDEYVWRLVKSDKDEFTRQAKERPHLGYFIRALPGVKSLSPVQACLYLATDRVSQNVHNIIIAEEGSELHIITGCSTAPGVASGLHIGVSEFYVKKGATLSFTMIHNWSEGVVVRPRSSIRVEENGRFINNYVVLNPVESIQMYPSTHLAGDNAVASLNSILVAPKGSTLDIGGRAVLSGKNTRAEIIARAITTGGTIYSRGQIVGEVPGVKAHLECKGLILGGGGSIIAIPELEGRAEDVELSHEAAVGRINQTEINYLMARGLTEDEAVGVIVRGFLHVDIQGLPADLTEEINRNIQKGQKEYL